MSLDLQSQRNKLPITKHHNDVLYLCEKFQTLILVGSTGSGKSTQIGQVCMRCILFTAFISNSIPVFSGGVNFFKCWGTIFYFQ